MIVLLTGILREVGEQTCVVDVGGVGYELGISATSLTELGECGKTVTLYVRMRVSESYVALFGFCTKEERTLFDKLTVISGIGPKVALSMLSAYTPETLCAITLSEDINSLTAIPGIGKKTASRLLVELKNIFAEGSELSYLSKSHAMPSPDASSSWEVECVAALTSMGFSVDEAQHALARAKEAGADSLEVALGKCLKFLGGGAHVGSR